MANLNVADIATDRVSGATIGKGSHLPAVVILNMFYSGLGIARDSSGKGVRVIGLSADRNACGNFTRFCEIRRAPSSQQHPQELADFLLQANNDLWGSVIFPTRDSDVTFLDRYRSDLQNRYILPIPSSRCLRRTNNKHELAIAASQAGVPVPRTVQLNSVGELTQVADNVGFPCVLKPISSVEWHEGDAWERVGCRKAVRVDNWNSLTMEYEAISRVTPRVLVQEWVSGQVDQIVILGGYVNRSSELIAYFTARKLLQFPDDCGTGCVVRAEAIDAIVAPSRRLFHELQYEGMAEVEYKYDSRSGQYKLIEINTRHWDQHRLGTASGLNLTWLAYCNSVGRELPSVTGSRKDAVWIAEDALAIRLARSLIRHELRVPGLWKKISGPRIYGMFAVTDPLPWCRCFTGTVVPELVEGAFHKLRTYLRSRV